MDPHKQHRDAIYEFIVARVSIHFFRNDQTSNTIREDKSNLSNDFRTYQDFTEHQRAVIDELDVSTLTFIHQLQNLCLVNNVDVHDQRDHSYRSTGGFFFSREGIISIIVVP